MFKKTSVNQFSIEFLQYYSTVLISRQSGALPIRFLGEFSNIHNQRKTFLNFEDPKNFISGCSLIIITIEKKSPKCLPIYICDGREVRSARIKASVGKHINTRQLSLVVHSSHDTETCALWSMLFALYELNYQKINNRLPLLANLP